MTTPGHDPGDEDDGENKRTLAALLELFVAGAAYTDVSVSELRAQLRLPEPPAS